MSVDRLRRNCLLKMLSCYLNDEMTAFAFDTAIFEIRSLTTDQTVKHVVDSLWHFYDDCKDHKVHLNKQEWDYVQRLRLLLESDAALEVSATRVWSWTQALAAIALAGFAWLAIQAGFGRQLLVVAIPFGVVSIAIAHHRGRMTLKSQDGAETLDPFSSFGQLRSVRRRVSHFRKQPYPSQLASRRVRSALGEFGIMLQMYSAWLLCSPAVLVMQLFPNRISIRQGRVLERLNWGCHSLESHTGPVRRRLRRCSHEGASR